jgi:hypothetical protein
MAYSALVQAQRAAPRLYRKGGVVASTRRIETSRLEVSTNKRDGKVRLAGVELGNQCGALDVTWLRSASQAYDISPDPRDYVIVELPIVTADIPNRNMDAFPYVELTSFNTLVGRVVYQTLIGKPTFQDHDNQNPKKAKGVIFDAVFRKLGNIWQVRELAGFDRGKDAQLVRSILAGKRDKYSMGALAGYVACSVCGKTYDGNTDNACEDIRKAGKGNLVGDRLVYDQCLGVNFCETSSVEDPADITAKSDSLLQT